VTDPRVEFEGLPHIGERLVRTFGGFAEDKSQEWLVVDYDVGTKEVEFQVDGRNDFCRLGYDETRGLMSSGWLARRVEDPPEEPEKTLYLMQGVPGSGKSTVARMIGAWHCLGDMEAAKIVSTDDWRLVDGAYVFDAADNARYHQLAQREAARLMLEGQPVVIVDNTNIKEWQARPYITLARIHGYTVQVVNVDCGLQVAIDRQAEREGLGDRAVPAEVITTMYHEMERVLT
jgi:predicted kinase